MFKLRMIGKIIRQAKLGHITVAYALIFLGCSLGISAASPAVGGLGNALWLCFQTATTVGFGDTATQGLVVRALLVIVSTISVFYLAIITGVVVAYCTEVVKAQAKESIMRFADDLEHLEEKSPEELRALSLKVKNYRLQ